VNSSPSNDASVAAFITRLAAAEFLFNNAHALAAMAAKQARYALEVRWRSVPIAMHTVPAIKR
jgi:hypothetical protein